MPPHKILLIGSRRPEVAQLRSPNALERWNRFRFTCMASRPYLPEGAAIVIGGGAWRQEFFAGFSDPPACWTQLEMAKFLSGDRKLSTNLKASGTSAATSESGLARWPLPVWAGISRQ